MALAAQGSPVGHAALEPYGIQPEFCLILKTNFQLRFFAPSRLQKYQKLQVDTCTDFLVLTSLCPDFLVLTSTCTDFLVLTSLCQESWPNNHFCVCLLLFSTSDNVEGEAKLALTHWLIAGSSAANLAISQSAVHVELTLIPTAVERVVALVPDDLWLEYAIPRTRLKIAQKSFTYTGIGIWSSVDPTIRSIPNYHLFVTKLKHKLQEEQWYQP